MCTHTYTYTQHIYLYMHNLHNKLTMYLQFVFTWSSFWFLYMYILIGLTSYITFYNNYICMYVCMYVMYVCHVSMVQIECHFLTPSFKLHFVSSGPFSEKRAQKFAGDFFCCKKKF